MNKEQQDLTLDTEPSELLFVERNKVQEMYKQAIQKSDKLRLPRDYCATFRVLTDLFGDKCLSDKELEQTSVQVESRLKVGDKVRLNFEHKDGEYDTIENIVKSDYGVYLYHLKNDGDSYAEKYLEPYTEPETKDMEEKELDLTQLLKGCEDTMILYSRAYGDVSLNEIVRDDRPNSQEIKVYTSDPQSDRIWFLRNGRKHKNGEIDLWPSRVLYEKYPLDPYSAWMEWKEARKPKRWRAKEGEYFYLITTGGEISNVQDRYSDYCNDLYNLGNYFRTEEEAKQAAEVVKEALQKFHEKNSEK